jgi:hypothetical protein
MPAVRTLTIQLACIPRTALVIEAALALNRSFSVGTESTKTHRTVRKADGPRGILLEQGGDAIYYWNTRMLALQDSESGSIVEH